ncbi:putative transporter [Trachipleistophora hominis]|uniref:Putative transporter n=1 Tax=Trachipleistophora hominis TaxID=72359 RepID=L7JZ53_TRAHO|nr:putative transporter [Trachipleistophora hominis]
MSAPENKPPTYVIKEHRVQIGERGAEKDIKVPYTVLEGGTVILVLGELHGSSRAVLEGMCNSVACLDDVQHFIEESGHSKKSAIKKIILDSRVSVHSTSSIFNILYFANNQHSNVDAKMQRTQMLLEQLGLSACFYMNCSELNKLYHTLVAMGVFVMQGYDVFFLDDAFCGMSECECEKLVIIAEELAKYYGVLFVVGSDGYGGGGALEEVYEGMGCDEGTAGDTTVHSKDDKTGHSKDDKTGHSKDDKTVHSKDDKTGHSKDDKTGSTSVNRKCFKALVVRDSAAELRNISGLSRVIKDVVARNENAARLSDGRSARLKKDEKILKSLLRGITGNFRPLCVAFQVFLILIIFVGVALLKNSSDQFKIELLVRNTAGGERADIKDALTPAFLEKEHGTNGLVLCASLISFAVPLVPFFALRRNVEVLFADCVHSKRIISLNVLARMLHECALCACFSLIMCVMSALLLSLSPVFSFLFVLVSLVSARLFCLVCADLRFSVAGRFLLYACSFAPAVLYPFLLAYPLSHDVHKFIAFLPQVSVLRYMHAVLYTAIRPALAHEHRKVFDTFLNALYFPTIGDYRVGLIVLFLYLAVLWMIAFFVMKNKLRRAFRVK